MPTITSLGIGSGLDINTIVEQLVALERRPLTQMRSDASALQTQISSYGKINSLFSSLQTAATKLAGSTLWAQTSASSGDAASVSVIGGAGAASGRYGVKVSALAASQTAVSRDALGSAGALVGSGTLTLEIGSWDAGQTLFTARSGNTPIDITVTATDTMQSLRDKINGLGAGVTASLVSDSAGVRLALRSTTTGAENGFRLAVNDDDGLPADGAGLSRFAFDPPASPLGMERKQAAKNASAEINGIAVESASNELTGVVDGLTIQLRKETGTAEVEVAVSSDRDGIRAAVKAFAEAYSALAANIAEQTKYDANTKTGGPLQGDSAASSLQRQMRNALNGASGASATFPRLSDIGLQVQRDGTLKLDDAKLDAAMSNLTELKKAFANNDTLTPANAGFARRYADLATQVLGVDGSLTTRAEGLRQRLSRNAEDQAKLGERVDRFKDRLVAQYTAMDANLARLNALSSYVTQQIAALNRTNNNQ